jgi:transcriptional regulator with XRE-family HTH domain
MTLQQVEDTTGIRAMRLSRIERGLVTPPDSVPDQLATTLAVPRPDFYKAAGRRPPSSGQPADAVDAIMADPILSEQEKAYLVHGLILLRSRHARVSIATSQASIGQDADASEVAEGRKLSCLKEVHGPASRSGCRISLAGSQGVQMRPP